MSGQAVWDGATARSGRHPHYCENWSKNRQPFCFVLRPQAHSVVHTLTCILSQRPLPTTTSDHRAAAWTAHAWTDGALPHVDIVVRLEVNHTRPSFARGRAEWQGWRRGTGGSHLKLGGLFASLTLSLVGRGAAPTVCGRQVTAAWTTWSAGRNSAALNGHHGPNPGRSFRGRRSRRTLRPVSHRVWHTAR